MAINTFLDVLPKYKDEIEKYSELLMTASRSTEGAVTWVSPSNSYKSYSTTSGGWEQVFLNIKSELETVGKCLPSAARLNEIVTEVNKIESLTTSTSDNSKAFVAGGTSTALTLMIPSVSAYAPYLTIKFIANLANGGAATTININGLGAKPLYKRLGGSTNPNLTQYGLYTICMNGTSSSFFLEASAEGTATVAQVLAGVPFSNQDDTGLIGEIPSKSAQTYTPSQSVQTISSGQYLSGTQTISAVTFDAAKVLSDTTIAGKVGTIPSKSAATYTPSQSIQTIASGQYLSGVQTISAVPVTASTVLVGTTIAGVAGTIPNKVGTIPALSTTKVGNNLVVYPEGGSYNYNQSASISVTKDQMYVADNDFHPSNLKEGIECFGFVGTYTPITPGESIIASNDAVVTTSVLSFTLMKKFLINQTGTYRVSRDMASTSYANIRSQIYKNGVPYGQIMSQMSANWYTHTEDLSFANGDTCELWVYEDYGGTNVSVSNFRLKIGGISVPTIV